MKTSAVLSARCAIEQTFATDEGERACPCLLLESLDLALSVDRGRGGGSEVASKVGRLVIGNRFSPGPGLADRVSRGQGISRTARRTAAGSAVALYYWKCIRDLG
jgi:hypothetical protein